MTESVVQSQALGKEERVKIRRPDNRNALNREVADGIMAAICATERDSDCRVIVLTGEGERAFCAGGDIKAGADGGPFVQDPADPDHFAGRLFETIQACRKPTIARINGVAMGAGIICACDLAVMADHARIGTPEVKVGLFPMTIVPLMMRVLPRRRLMEMFITGVPLTAEEALQFNLVNYVTDAAGLDDKVAELVAQIAAQSPSAIRLPGSVGEQMLYEIGDPRAYLLPDVICDWSGVTLEQVGPDQVLVKGGMGLGRTDSYKVSATHADGWRAVSTLTLAAIDAPAKAERVAEAILTRCRRIFRDRNMADFRQVSVEVLGAEAAYGANARARTREVVLKIGAVHDDRAALNIFAGEIAPMAISTA